MDKIIEYTIISGSNMQMVADSVAKYSKMGFILQGGISISSTDDWDMYAQAMIKIESKDKE